MRARLSDGAQVVVALNLGDRSILSVRMKDGKMELWAVEDGHIQHTVRVNTREEMSDALDQWKPWLSKEAPPKDKLN